MIFLTKIVFVAATFLIVNGGVLSRNANQQQNFGSQSQQPFNGYPRREFQTDQRSGGQSGQANGNFGAPTPKTIQQIHEPSSSQILDADSDGIGGIVDLELLRRVQDIIEQHERLLHTQYRSQQSSAPATNAQSSSGSSTGYSAPSSNAQSYSGSSSGYSAPSSSSQSFGGSSSAYSAPASNSLNFGASSNGYSAPSSNTQSFGTSSNAYSAPAGNAQSFSSSTSGYSAPSANAQSFGSSSSGYSAPSTNSQSYSGNNNGFSSSSNSQSFNGYSASANSQSFGGNANAYTATTVSPPLFSSTSSPQSYSNGITQARFLSSPPPSQSQNGGFASYVRQQPPTPFALRSPAQSQPQTLQQLQFSAPQQQRYLPPSQTQQFNQAQQYSPPQQQYSQNNNQQQAVRDQPQQQQSNQYDNIQPVVRNQEPTSQQFPLPYQPEPQSQQYGNDQQVRNQYSSNNIQQQQPQQQQQQQQQYQQPEQDNSQPPQNTAYGFGTRNQQSFQPQPNSFPQNVQSDNGVTSNEVQQQRPQENSAQTRGSSFEQIQSVGQAYFPAPTREDPYAQQQQQRTYLPPQQQQQQQQYQQQQPSPASYQRVQNNQQAPQQQQQFVPFQPQNGQNGLSIRQSYQQTQSNDNQQSQGFAQQPQNRNYLPPRQENTANRNINPFASNPSQSQPQQETNPTLPSIFASPRIQQQQPSFYPPSVDNQVSNDLSDGTSGTAVANDEQDDAVVINAEERRLPPGPTYLPPSSPASNFQEDGNLGVRFNTGFQTTSPAAEDVTTTTGVTLIVERTENSEEAVPTGSGPEDSENVGIRSGSLSQSDNSAPFEGYPRSASPSTAFLEARVVNAAVDAAQTSVPTSALLLQSTFQTVIPQQPVISTLSPTGYYSK